MFHELYKFKIQSQTLIPHYLLKLREKFNLLSLMLIQYNVPMQSTYPYRTNLHLRIQMKVLLAENCALQEA
jgi:hypothetical protein